MKFKRKWACGICDKDVIADTEAYTMTCDCGTIPFPQWVQNDAYMRRKYLNKLLENFEPFKEGEEQ